MLTVCVENANPPTGDETIMDAEMLSRIQFGVSAGFHFLYPPLSIGLAVILVLLEAQWLRTKEEVYHTAARFWTRIFALIFAMGVVTGIVLEFEFGTNWAAYSRYVGDVFGSPLAIEAIMAFFLESTFLGVLVFGWNRIGPKTHFFSTCMVCLGAHLSAVWIIVANSWMHTPAGYHIVIHNGVERAEIVSFWRMVFNPSTIDRLAHVILAAWITGAALVTAVAAYYLLRNRHDAFARISMKFGLALFAFASFAQLISGDASARTVAVYQPVKLAAFEGLYDTERGAPLRLFGWVDEKEKKVYGPEIPGMLSFLAHHDFNAEVTGLNTFPEDLHPPVQVVFQTFHLMVGLGMIFIGMSLVGLFLWWKGSLFHAKGWFVRLYLWAVVAAVIGPQIANQAGWVTTEVGRQPWIVQGLLRTKDGLSESLHAGEVWFSLVLFTGIYVLLLSLFVFLLLRKIAAGPSAQSESLAEEPVS
jgi:cytochrome bd ubiquinol oxidase subunit I